MFLFFLDSLMQQVWNHAFQNMSYEQFINTAKLTPRSWNSPGEKLQTLLQHLTWCLNLNINIIGFKESRHFFKCENHSTKCFIPYYVFQNTLVKLLRNSIVHVNILIVQKKLYILSTNNFYPLLINIPEEKEILLFDNYPVTKNDILLILQNQLEKTFVFNINIYTSYKYVITRFTNQIEQNLVGNYVNVNNKKTLHVFITPHLTNRNFNLHVMANMDNVCLKSNALFQNTHIKEGRNFKIKPSKNKQDLLNQNHCICEHPETQRIFTPPLKSYRNLATLNVQKYFLYENLIALGLLTPNLKQCLQICSELSILSFDTEALNKSLIPPDLYTTNNVDDMFINRFQTTSEKKCNYGVQQLYTIGLYDPLPFQKALSILKTILPLPLFLKLKKYVTGDLKTLRCHVNWETFKSTLDILDLEGCTYDFLELFKNMSTSEEHVKTFHISKNDQLLTAMEPTDEKTCQMIYNFLTYIYQRNILVSIIKYILLKKTLHLFETSMLTETKKGIFELMGKRLNEIVFECILTAFNGSNYDNYLLLNYLIIIQTRLGQRIKIFKKGASITTIYLNFSKNLNSFRNILNYKKEKKIKKVTGGKWPSFLYIKDIRNLVAANMSLDKIGKLFNLKESKLCFPYNQAVSIKQLKNISSLKPYDELFWKDSFLNKTVPLETRLYAQNLFDKKGFKTLYEFGNYYLILDCLLLHSIVLTLFKTYLNDDINIFIRRNFSQSSLSYQQFFILEPSKQVKQINAPKVIKNTFFNYFIRQAVTGGLCTSFVHGNIDTNTIINEHLNYLEDPKLDKHTWPNFYNCKPWTNNLFQTNPSIISTIDIRSLYPSAAIKRIPVNSPLFYSRFTPDDFEKIKDSNLITLDLQDFCNNVQTDGDFEKDTFKLLNKPPVFYNEFYALHYYLQTLPTNLKILRFQSNFTALGQLYFGEYPIDGFLSFLNLDDNCIYMKIIQYNSVFYHGHSNYCPISNNEKEIEMAAKTSQVKTKIETLANHFIKHFNLSNVYIDYVEISDCDFFLHKIPKSKNFLFSYKKYYSYQTFLQTIYNKQLTGFLVLKNLEIKKNNQNPIFGFIIQKIEYDLKRLSPYTQEQLQHISSSKRVISLHKSEKYFVISTEYLNWLYYTFGFEKTPDIYHALLFQTDYYLKDSIENKLKMRKELKTLIKSDLPSEIRHNYEIQAELIKLMLNSCYGFTLCNVTSNKFKLLENRTQFPDTLKRQAKINMCIQISNNVFLVEKKKEHDTSFATLLGQVGCYILFNSKIILLKRLYFLLKHLNPTKAQLLYMDTDSAHFLLQHKKFQDNVDDNLKLAFQQLFNKHFETGNKLSGIWVHEGYFTSAEYIGEKSYKLINKTDNNYLTHMKGLNSAFQTQYVTENIDKQTTPAIGYNSFFKSPDFIIFKTHMSKELFTNFVPNKRYFVCATGSLPLKF